MDCIELILKTISSNWEAIVAISALFISTSALVIAFFALKAQKQHNCKSLKPFIFIAPYDYENRLVIKIKNEGVGPAIVKLIHVSNKKGVDKPNIFKWLPAKLPGDMNYKEYWTRSKDFVLKAGSEEHILEIPIDTNVPEQIETRESIRKTLSELTVVVKYEDVYENTMPIYKRALKLYARTDHEN